MSIKLIAVLVLLAALSAVGWRVHHAIYDSGYQAGVAAQAKKDKPDLDALAVTREANKSNLGVIAQLEASVKECSDGRAADVKAAQDAAIAASKARADIARQAQKSKQTLDSLMAGECREWAKLPACGSMR